jgi:5-formyltetrahydrofolate cyclo-ligase
MSSNDKAALRKEARSRRVVLGGASRDARSAKICAHILSTIEAEPVATVTGFASVKSEVNISEALAMLLARGVAVGLPRILDLASGQMSFDALLDPNELDLLVEGPYGISQRDKPRPLDPLAIDLMLVPLLGFDCHGSRLGAGAGFFDRYLADLIEAGATTRFLGVAFDTQEFDLLPREGHDVPLHGVITESGLRTFVPGS